MSLNHSLAALRVVAYLLLAFVAVWYTAAFAPIDAPARLLMDVNDWPLDGGHAALSRDARWLSAIGAGLLCWIALHLLLVVIPRLAAGDGQTWRGTVIGVLAWYLLDTVGSVAAGVVANVVVNTLLLALILLPLWAAKPVAGRAANGC